MCKQACKECFLKKFKMCCEKNALKMCFENVLGKFESMLCKRMLLKCIINCVFLKCVVRLASKQTYNHSTTCSTEGLSGYRN